MATRLKWTAIVLLAAFGVWLTLQHGVEGSLQSSWNCAGSRALFCIQR
jgi:hypothetical protein